MATGLLGIHLNFPATVDALMSYNKKGSAACFAMMTAQPQAVGYGVTDSPPGLAA